MDNVSPLRRGIKPPVWGMANVAHCALLRQYNFDERLDTMIVIVSPFRPQYLPPQHPPPEQQQKNQYLLGHYS